MTMVSKLSVMQETVRRSVAGDIARIHQLAVRPAWSFLTRPGGSDEVVLEGEGARGRTRRHPKLREDALDVARVGVLADHERGRDLTVALAGRQQAEHLELARRQPVRRPVVVRSRQRSEQLEIGRGSELREDAPSRVDLQGKRIVVAQRATRDADQQTRACQLVRRLELLPEPPRAAKVYERRVGR